MHLRRLGMISLAILELVWLAWFLVEPLPNTNNTGVATGTLMRRGWLVLKAIPQVVPDTSVRESILGQAVLELSHVENLRQRGPIVLTALLIAVAAVGLGDLLLRGLRLEQGIGLGERLALDYGLGAGLLGVLTLLLGRIGWLSPWPLRVGLGVVAAVGLFKSRLWRAARPRLDSAFWLKGLVIFPFVLVMILASMLPSIDFDVLEYHLQGPKEYYQAGRISFLPHNVYTNMPFNVEMLHLLAMEVMGDWWWGGLAGQLLVAFFGPAAAILIGGVARRGGSSRAGWIAGLVYLSTPWIYRLAAIAYVEGPLCFFHAALIWVAFRGSEALGVERLRFWGLLGLLAGCAMGCKYTGLVSAVIPFGLLALWDSWRKKSVAILACYVLGWSIVMVPWLAKNVVDTGNPVYPLAGRIFRSPEWDLAREAKWAAVHGPQPIEIRRLWVSLVEVAGRSDWQSPLYLALAPLAFLRPGSRRLALAVSAFVGYLFCSWWLTTHRLDRFWLPMLPGMAILAGLGADWARTRSWSIILGIVMTISLLANLTYISTALAGLNEWTGDLVYLRRHIPMIWNNPMARMDIELPQAAKPLLVGQAAVFHLNHTVAYNTVFNLETIEVLAKDRTPDELHRGLLAKNLTHVYVDWKEIRRLREPGNYGFTDFVKPSRFEAWVAGGVLEAPEEMGLEQALYRIRPLGRSRSPEPQAR